MIKYPQVIVFIDEELSILKGQLEECTKQEQKAKIRLKELKQYRTALEEQVEQLRDARVLLSSSKAA